MVGFHVFTFTLQLHLAGGFDFISSLFIFTHKIVNIVKQMWVQHKSKKWSETQRIRPVLCPFSASRALFTEKEFCSFPPRPSWFRFSSGPLLTYYPKAANEPVGFARHGHHRTLFFIHSPCQIERITIAELSCHTKAVLHFNSHILKGTQQLLLRRDLSRGVSAK